MAPKNKGGRPSNPTPRWNPEKERWEVRLSIPGLSGAKQMGTVPERRSRMKRVLEIIGTTPITSVTRDQITNVRDMLDGETLVRAEAAKAASKKEQRESPALAPALVEDRVSHLVGSAGEGPTRSGPTPSHGKRR